MRIFLFLMLVALGMMKCIHDEIIKKHKIEIYEPVQVQRRSLQNQDIGPLRIYIHDVQFKSMPAMIQQMMRLVLVISATFFQNVLTVRRLNQNIFFPKEGNATCNQIDIPDVFRDNGINQGVDSDLGILTQIDFPGAQELIPALAYAVTCVQQSTFNRPIWGAIGFNLLQISKFFQQKLTPEEFQTLIFVTIHELTHVLAFSASLYSTFNNPDLIYNDSDPFAIKFPSLKQLILERYNCSQDFYEILEDYNGGKSHWQKQIFANQLMIAEASIKPYISELTLTLFEMTGWYESVNKSYSEPSAWGKNKGCSFIKKQQCNYEQFCPTSEKYGSEEVGCDWSGIGIARCSKDKYIDQSCKIMVLSKDNLCLSSNYLKERVSSIEAGQQPGPYSRCFRGDVRKIDQKDIKIHGRCYPTLCLKSGSIIVFRIQQIYIYCLFPNALIKSPPGYQGTLICPSNFAAYCENKKNCPYNCNSRGVCIDGLCLCAGERYLTPSCPSPNQGSNRRLLVQERALVASQSMKCQQGKIFDPISKHCVTCFSLLQCSHCNNHQGCIQCDDKSQPIKGSYI